MIDEPNGLSTDQEKNDKEGLRETKGLTSENEQTMILIISKCLMSSQNVFLLCHLWDNEKNLREEKETKKKRRQNQIDKHYN